MEGKEEEAYLVYRLEGDVLVVAKTFVDAKYRGRGIAQKLVEETLAYAKKESYKVRPLCSYVESYMKRKNLL